MAKKRPEHHCAWCTSEEGRKALARVFHALQRFGPLDVSQVVIETKLFDVPSAQQSLRCLAAIGLVECWTERDGSENPVWGIRRLRMPGFLRTLFQRRRASDEKAA